MEIQGFIKEILCPATLLCDSKNRMWYSIWDSCISLEQPVMFYIVTFVQKVFFSKCMFDCHLKLWTSAASHTE